jgi:hypothetical protein
MHVSHDADWHPLWVAVQIHCGRGVAIFPRASMPNGRQGQQEQCPGGPGVYPGEPGKLDIFRTPTLSSREVRVYITTGGVGGRKLQVENLGMGVSLYTTLHSLTSMGATGPYGSLWDLWVELLFGIYVLGPCP